MCGLRTRPRTDVDLPRFLSPSNCRRRGHIVSPLPGRYLLVWLPCDRLSRGLSYRIVYRCRYVISEWCQWSLGLYGGCSFPFSMPTLISPLKYVTHDHAVRCQSHGYLPSGSSRITSQCLILLGDGAEERRQLCKCSR